MIIKYSKLITLIGSLLWFIGFFLSSARIYPQALIAVYSAPPILLIGIICWILKYQRTENKFPNPTEAYNRISNNYKGALKFHFSMFEFLTTYLLQFWTLSMVIWIIITITGVESFKNSTAFDVTKEYVENDAELKNRIGEVKYYGFLISGSISSSGDANIRFSIIGEKETLGARAILENGEVIEVIYD